jgi:hypothetical protein
LKQLSQDLLDFEENQWNAYRSADIDTRQVYASNDDLCKYDAKFE